MGLEGTCRLGQDFKVINGGQATKCRDHLLLGELAPQAPSKDFHLANGGGLGWMKWLKMGQRKILYFMQFFLYYILFGENFIG